MLMAIKIIKPVGILSQEDSINYITFMADVAHSYGMAMGVKNGIEMLQKANTFTKDKLDFAVNEQCQRYKECGLYKTFAGLGKPVLNVEYLDEISKQTVCGGTRSIAGLSTIMKPFRAHVTKETYYC